jgi:hypothetical protein
MFSFPPATPTASTLQGLGGRPEVELCPSDIESEVLPAPMPVEFGGVLHGLAATPEALSFRRLTTRSGHAPVEAEKPTPDRRPPGDFTAMDTPTTSVDPDKQFANPTPPASAGSQFGFKADRGPVSEHEATFPPSARDEAKGAAGKTIAGEIQTEGSNSWSSQDFGVGPPHVIPQVVAPDRRLVEAKQPVMAALPSAQPDAAVATEAPLAVPGAVPSPGALAGPTSNPTRTGPDVPYAGPREYRSDSKSGKMVANRSATPAVANQSAGAKPGITDSSMVPPAPAAAGIATPRGISEIPAARSDAGVFSAKLSIAAPVLPDSNLEGRQCGPVGADFPAGRTAFAAIPPPPQINETQPPDNGIVQAGDAHIATMPSPEAAPTRVSGSMPEAGPTNGPVPSASALAAGASANGSIPPASSGSAADPVRSPEAVASAPMISAPDFAADLNADPALRAPTAQIAANDPLARPGADGANGKENKNNTKHTEGQAVAKLGAAHGTETANVISPMQNSPLAVSTSRPAAASNQGGPLPAAATALVERVVRTAGLVASQPAEKVNVRIELPEMGAIELQVAMRDGQVQASFRADSPEVRAALASAWSDFVGGREASAHSWAEPVFAPLAAGSVPASGDSGSSPSPFGEERGSPQQDPSFVGHPFVSSLHRGGRGGADPTAIVIPPDPPSPSPLRLLQATA